MSRLLVATHNAGKMREFRELLRPLAGGVLFPVDLGIEIDVAEVGSTYVDNARIKAAAYAEQTRARGASLLVLADDSGLEVDALDGAPGVHSARYTFGSDADRLSALLYHMQGVPPAQRTARFRCVVAILTPEGVWHETQGVCEGVIAEKPAGDGGFGYDPVFYIPQFGCTMAELPAEVKNQVSHRARAVQAALPILRQLMADGGSVAGQDMVGNCPSTRSVLP